MATHGSVDDVVALQGRDGLGHVASDRIAESELATAVATCYALNSVAIRLMPLAAMTFFD